MPQIPVGWLILASPGGLAVAILLLIEFVVIRPSPLKARGRSEPPGRRQA